MEQDKKNYAKSLFHKMYYGNDFERKLSNKEFVDTYRVTITKNSSMKNLCSMNCKIKQENISECCSLHSFLFKNLLSDCEHEKSAYNAYDKLVRQTKTDEKTKEKYYPLTKYNPEVYSPNTYITSLLNRICADFIRFRVDRVEVNKLDNIGKKLFHLLIYNQSFVYENLSESNFITISDKLNVDINTIKEKYSEILKNEKLKQIYGEECLKYNNKRSINNIQSSDEQNEDKPIMEFEAPEKFDPGSNENLEKIALREILLKLKEKNEFFFNIINLFFNKNMSDKEIGEIFGISQSEVSRNRYKAIDELKKLYVS